MSSLRLSCGGRMLIGGVTGAWLAAAWLLLGSEVTVPQFHLRPMEPGGGSLEVSGVEPDEPWWPEPRAQARGARWKYDLFEPPLIRRSRFDGRLEAGLPEIAAANVPEPELDISLHSVVQEPFRLQLVGFVGEGPRLRGTFRRVPDGDLRFAAAGEVFASLDLQVLEVTLASEWDSGERAEDAPRRAAYARVKDVQRGSIVTLSSSGRTLAEIIAWVSLPDESELRRVRQGDVIDVGGERLVVHRIFVSPMAVEFARVAVDGAQRLHRLEPAAAEWDAGADSVAAPRVKLTAGKESS